MSNITELFTSPEYDQNVEDWIKYYDLYDGDHETLCQEKYLWLHEFEASEKGGKLRTIRENRTRYTNLIKPFIRRFTSMVYRQEINISGVTDLVSADIMNNIDGKETDFLSFFRNCVARDYFLFGKAFILADAFNIEGELSQAEARQAGKRPFLECISPLAVKDWQVDLEPGPSFGNLIMFRYEFQMLEKRTSLLEKPQVGTYSKILQKQGNGFTSTIYKLNSRQRGQNEMWKVYRPETFHAGFEQLPVVWFSGESWIREVSDLALTHYNAESSLDSQLLYQAFQRILFIGDFEKRSGATINEGTALFIPGEGQVQVLEPTNPIALERRIDKVLNNMYKVAFNQARTMPTDSKMVEGAETQKESKDDFLSLVNSAARDLEELTNKAVMLIVDFLGKEYNEEKYYINYNKQISSQDVEKETELMLSFLTDIRKFPTWNKSVLKKVATQMNLAEEESIHEEIDTTGEQVFEESKKQREALFVTSKVDELIDADTNAR